MGADDLSKRADVVELEAAKVHKRERREQAVQDALARDDRPRIEVEGGALSANVDRIETLLARASGIYQRAGELVRVATAAEAGMVGDDTDARPGVRRDPEAPVIVRMGTDAVRVEIGRRAKFLARAPDGSPRIADCPADYAAGVVALGAWPTIRRLSGIAGAPVLRPDGSIAQHPGYDRATGLYLNLAPDWPTIAAEPSEAQAREALAELLEPFSEFPFASEGARAALASAILSRLVVGVLPTCPAFYALAPDAGSGKTLLTDAVSTIASGLVSAKHALPESDEETRKLLTSCLLAGDEQITFDNVPRGALVKSPVLDAAITSGVWSDRVLGASRTVSLPFRALVAFTGNNISPYGDAVRRGLYCRIEPGVEQPEARTFKIPDLLAYLREHRRRLVVAALTVMRAYVAAGRPCELSPLGSFEAWSRLVREPLVWLDMVDPVLTQREMRAGDDERTDLGELLEALTQAFGAEWFFAAGVYALCYPEAGLIGADKALRAAMRCDEGRHQSPKSMGRRLKTHAGRAFAGRRIESRHNPERDRLEFRCVPA